LDPVSVLREGQRQREFRQFDVNAMALALRQAIDGAVLELSRDPDYDVIGTAANWSSYSTEPPAGKPDEDSPPRNP